MAQGRPSNPLALAVLALLYERPMHPYQMSATLRERNKEDSIKLNYGSLYSVVDSLDKRALIEEWATLRDGRRPERTVYAITPAGARVMVDWLSDLLSTPVKEYPRFESALSLMPVLPPEEVIELLEQRLVQLNRRRKACEGELREAGRTGFPRLFTVESEFQVALLAAETEFVQRLLADLRSGEFGGLGLWGRMHELRAAGLSQDEVEAALQEEFKEDFGWLDDSSTP